MVFSIFAKVFLQPESFMVETHLLIYSDGWAVVSNDTQGKTMEAFLPGEPNGLSHHGGSKANVLMILVEVDDQLAKPLQTG